MADARAHHYRFAHQLLPQFARDAGHRVLDGTPPGDVTPNLVRMWTGFGESLPAADRLPADGLTAQRLTYGGIDLLLVTLPAPAAPPEAYYAAIARAQGSTECRYFTLEHTVDVLTGNSATMYGGWSERGHLNYGPGPETPGVDAFLAKLTQLTA